MKYPDRRPPEPPGLPAQPDRARPASATPQRGLAAPAPPEACLYDLISRTTRTATAVLNRELAAGGAADVRPAYLGVLMALWSEDDRSAADLAREAGLEPSSLTGLLDRMERAGLIERHPDARDRRALRIRLTRRGRRCEPAVRAVVNDTLARASQGVREDDVARALRVLFRVLENLSQERRSGA